MAPSVIVEVPLFGCWLEPPGTNWVLFGNEVWLLLFGGSLKMPPAGGVPSVGLPNRWSPSNSDELEEQLKDDGSQQEEENGSQHEDEGS